LTAALNARRCRRVDSPPTGADRLEAFEKILGHGLLQNQTVGTETDGFKGFHALCGIHAGFGFHPPNKASKLALLVNEPALL
jgi:hypothetical protein